MKETARMFFLRKWRKLLLILLAVLLAHWLLMTPANVDMEIHHLSPPDSVSIGTTSLKTQAQSPLFFWATPWAASTVADDLPKIKLAASGTTNLRMDFGLLTAPHKVTVAACDMQESDRSRSIDLWLKHSSQRDVPHTYTPGLLEIPLPRDDRYPLQLLIIEATWYGILGPKTATYAVTVNGWEAVV